MITSKYVLGLLESETSIISNITNSLKRLGLKTTREDKIIYIGSGEQKEVIIMASSGGNGFTLFSKTDTGVGISIRTDIKLVDFLKINSASPGMGSKMVDAVISNVPSDWTLGVDRDWSKGFWSKIQSRYSNRKWLK